jgi:creatinine amidohydrolase
MSEVRLERMRPDQVLAARERAPVAYVPIGPLEWHGEHLPFGVDGLHAHHVAVRAAQRSGGVVLPALHLGADAPQGPGTPDSLERLGMAGGVRVVGMDYPGNTVRSVYVDEGVVGLAVREIVRALKAEPYRVIVIVNGHGALNHQRALRRVAIEETTPGAVAVMCATAWVPPAPPANDPGHADRLETAILMALEPDTVDIGALPPLPHPLRYADHGIVDGAAFDGAPQPDFRLPDAHDPRHASAAEGTKIVEDEVERLCSLVAVALEAV